MKTALVTNLTATAALVLSAAWVIAWTTGLFVGADSWPLRIGLLAGGALLAAGPAALLVYRRRKDLATLSRFADALAKLDPNNVHSDVPGGEPRRMPGSHPIAAKANRLRDVVLAFGKQIQDLEHLRTAADMRARRANNECEQIKQIFSGLVEPVLAIDDYDEVVLANQSAEELLRLEGADTETRALAQLVECQKLVDLLTGTSHHSSSGNRVDEIEITDQQGETHWYRATVSKLGSAEDTDGDGASSATGAVAVLRDIGDQKALQRRNAEFVSAVSHEMKTPLAGIKAYVELLVDGDAEDEETREEFLDVINGQADRLQRLIENLLNLARIEAGVVNVSKQDRSLNEVLEEALRVVQPSAEAKQIELVSELSPMYLSVLADRDMLLQSAINLLSNAIKYTPEGGRVALRSRLLDAGIRFEVEDTGVGLSEEDSQRVFDKFYRVKKDKNMASGTGLGLPLAKHIVEDVHGGELAVTSTLGEGSTFGVTLPNAGQMT